MNIAVLMDTPVWGGAEIHAVGFTRTLLERGHLATLVTLTQRARDLHRKHVEPELPKAFLGAKEPLSRVTYRQWLRLFADQSWDTCVLVKGDIYTGGGWAIDLAARRRFGRYLVLEQKDVNPLGPRSSRRHLGLLPGLGLWWYREHFRRYLRSLGPRKIVCVSEANRQRLMNEHRFPARKLATVRNGANVDRFRRDDGARKVWRRRWGISDQALVFGAVGRFHPFKGYGMALTGFQATLQSHPRRESWLVLAGDGPEAEALRARAEEIRPRGRVIFLPFQERPEEVLSAFDLFVMPSVIEGLPLALAEAMACECPPIATAVGGIPEAVSDPDFGWLAAAGDGDAFANAMMDAASRPVEALTQMGRRARQQVLDHFNANVQFNKLAEIVESLENESRGGDGRRGGSR